MLYFIYLRLLKNNMINNFKKFKSIFLNNQNKKKTICQKTIKLEAQYNKINYNK